MKIEYKMFPIYFILLGMMLILVCQPFKFFVGVSLGTYAILVGTFMLFIQYIRTIVVNKGFIKISVDFLLFVYLIIFSSISLMVSLEFEYEAFVRLVTFLELPILLMSVRKIEMQKTKKLIYRLFILLSVFFICVSFTNVAYSYTTKYGIRYIDDLTLGYNNPNETAMYLYVCYSIMLSFWFNGNTKKCNVFGLIIALVLFYLILLTNSRICIILESVTLFYAVFFRKHILSPIFRKIIWISPVVFLILTVGFQPLLQSMMVLGDSLETGRYSLYISVLDNVNILRFFLGDFSIRFLNMHNVVITVFGTIGLFGLIVYALFLYVKIESDYRYRKNNIAFFSIYMIVLHSSVEAGLLLSGSVFAALVFCLYLIALT